MDPKFRQALFGGGGQPSGFQGLQQNNFEQQQQNLQVLPSPKKEADDEAMVQSHGNHSAQVQEIQTQTEQSQQAGYKTGNSGFISQLTQMLNLNELPDSLSIVMTAGGVLIDKKSVKIDSEGSVDMVTGERYQQVLKTDIEYGEVLGKGNGGLVQKGVHKVSGLPVAIKIINLFDKDKRHQFYNEFDMIQQFCPVFVRYYGAFYDEAKIHLVMEYMDCGSVESMIAVEKHFRTAQDRMVKPLIPEYVISRFAWHILQALNILHSERKQIHRDIKPDNILVESNLGMAKLSDFGISKQLREVTGGEAMNEHTRTYTGTLCYMSPERIQSQDYSFPADIWSLGVVVYEMATGEHPYPKTDRPIEIHNWMLAQPAPSLVGSTIVSIELADFIACCLIKDPDHRARAVDLLGHPFIQYFLHQNNEDHIAWLKENKEKQIYVKNMNAQKTVDLASLGIDAGLNI